MNGGNWMIKRRRGKEKEDKDGVSGDGGKRGLKTGRYGQKMVMMGLIKMVIKMGVYIKRKKWMNMVMTVVMVKIMIVLVKIVKIGREREEEGKESDTIAIVQVMKQVGQENERKMKEVTFT